MQRIFLSTCVSFLDVLMMIHFFSFEKYFVHFFYYLRVVHCLLVPMYHPWKLKRREQR